MLGDFADSPEELALAVEQARTLLDILSSYGSEIAASHRTKAAAYQLWAEALLNQAERSQAQIAQQVGITQPMIARWRREWQVAVACRLGDPDNGLSPAMRDAALTLFGGVKAALPTLPNGRGRPHP